MKRASQHLVFYTCALVLFALISCTQNPPESSKTTATEEVEEQAVGVSVEAEQFMASEGDITKEADFIIAAAPKASLTFEVNIPEAGRYRTEVVAQADSDSAKVWIEDYVDNKDKRTYDITGKIAVPNATSFANCSKDGSPLNKGMHKIKLHLQDGNIKVDKINFVLMKAHQTTPETLTQNTEGKEWQVVWSDEFDKDGAPDPQKWTYDIGDWGWGNNELQYYTEGRSENARVENGNLIIEARKNDDGKEWTSARLTTRGKVTFLYGRIEFKAKVPPLRGNWAAGWTLGDAYIDELSWPYCGEIDILESVGYQMDDETGNGKAHASVHCGAYYFKLGNQHTNSIDVENMVDEYHVYAVDWTPEGITATIDGKPYFTYKETTPELAWPFNQAQNIILNLAIGGGWGGLEGIDESMNKQQFIIDYVRVYELR